MQTIQNIGIFLFALALILFTALVGIDNYLLKPEAITADNDYHREAITNAAREKGLFDQTFRSSFAFVPAYKTALKTAQKKLEEQAAEEIPEGVAEWDFKLGDWKIKDYVFQTTKAAAFGPVSNNPLLFLLGTIGLALLGGLLYILPLFNLIPGIKNDHIYHSSLTRGLQLPVRRFFISAILLGVLLFGIFYMNNNWFWPAVSAVVAALIIGLVLFYEGNKLKEPTRSASPQMTAWLGVLTGVYLIGFYILLYWAPQHITGWITITDPLSRSLSGNPASQWFLYGLLYTLIVVVMGIRMIAKYRHNRYQMVRTGSVMFFQTAFAFLIPEMLVRLNQPYFDFKNIWPLNYTFFFDYNLSSLISSGALGMFMLVWGIALIVMAVPVFSYFFGKRWYCSWVCGCGGLAETMGDPYRQLSDKSLRAWKFERWIIHGVLVFAVVMTALVLYSYFSGQRNVLFLNSDSVRSWYGFLIGSAFAGVVGTGFYPLMGNRVWCRFGCPLAAYLGLVQRFKSRFRITTNGGQCISCGNCSTYCEMGIDVRWYAQRGQDIVRSSCVGCGICSAVCPRGVLRLENAPNDISERAQTYRTLHVTKEGVQLPM